MPSNRGRGREAWGDESESRRGGGRSPSPTPRNRRDKRQSTSTPAKQYPEGRAPHLRLPQPGQSSREEVTADQPLAAFAGNEQLILENFYAKYEPTKKSSEIQRELLEARSFEQLCGQLERKYKQEDGPAVNPETLWDMPYHGRIGTGLRKGKAAKTEKMNARKTLAAKKMPSAKVAQEQRLMNAKVNMQAAFYKPGMIKMTKRVIDQHLRKAGFDEGIEMATPDQIQRAKREIMLAGNTPDDPNEWVDQLFRKKDRDGSMSLSFDEFRATIRRYGKIPPRELASQAEQDREGFKSKAITDEDLRTIFNRVDDSQDGEIQIEEFKDWLDEQPSDEYQKFERSTAPGGKTRNIRVRSLEPETRDREGLPGKGSELRVRAAAHPHRHRCSCCHASSHRASHASVLRVPLLT
jgi:Ca2+-binding EF-hand superfamily protein